MSKRNGVTAAEEWNLLLVATCAVPDTLLEPLRAAVVASGGQVLSQGQPGPYCADIDFEFPRAKAVEVYGLLIAAGVLLSREAHAQLTALCQCTRHIHPGAQSAPARVSLTLYPTEGSEDFLESMPQELQAAA